MQEIEKREMQLKVEKDMEAKALRAASRSYDETAVWFWASGLSDGSDGEWEHFAQPVIDQLEHGWATGEEQLSIFPLQGRTSGHQGPEYVVDMTQMVQRQAANRFLQRRILRRGGSESGLALPQAFRA